MRILHILGGFSEKYGGIARAVYGLSEAQSRLGHDVSILALTKRSEVEEVLKPEGVNLKVILEDCLSGIWPSHSNKLRQQIHEYIEESDIVHIHGIWTYYSYLGAKIAYRLKIPYIISPHGSLTPWCLDWKRAKKKVYMKIIQEKQMQRASIIHAVNDKEAQEIAALMGDVNICVVPNGVSLDTSISVEEEARFFERYPYLKENPYVLFLGRLHPIKGVDILIKAFAEFCKRENEYYLVIAGPDERGWRRDLELIAKSAGVEERVFFPGFINGSHKKCILANTSLSILPSFSEVLSVVSLEAMAFSRPIIITEGCGFAEVADVGAGIVVSPNVEEIAEAMREMLSDKVRLEEMGRRGRMLVSSKYSFGNIAEQSICMYAEAISEK